MGIKSETTILKSRSKNSNCKDTDKWEQANEVILLTTQNGGAAITDELPGSGIVKQRIAAQEQKIRNNELQSTNNVSPSITSSSSGLSISLQQSSEENLNARQEPKKSRIPVRSNSNVSVSSNLSSESSSLFSNSNSRIPTPILTRKNSNFLFNNNLDREIKNQKIIKVYEINKDKRWVLISPGHRFISQCCPKTTPALTYREADKIRVEHLKEEEIEILEQMLIEDTEKNSIGVRFLGKK